MLTKAGWGAVAMTATAIAIGRVFGVIELYIVAAAVAVALAWAAASTARPLPRLRARRAVVPGVVRAGESARVDLLISNESHRRSPVLALREPVGNAAATMHLAPMQPGERTVAAYRLPTTRRGVVRVGPLGVRRTDVLGLARRTTALAGTAELLVTPSYEPVVFGHGSIGGSLGDHLRLRALGQSGSEFHSLRPYAVGDDLRRVDWKASARTNDLIVKETAPEGMRRCTVVLDTSKAGHDDSSFERAVSVAASLVTGASASGLVTRFAAPGVDLRGPDVSAHAVRWLATVEAVDEPFAQPSSGRFGEGTGIALLVTSSLVDAPVDVVHSMLAPDDVLIIVFTRPVPSLGERFVVDATDDESFRQSWDQLVGLGARSWELPASYRVTT